MEYYLTGRQQKICSIKERCFLYSKTVVDIETHVSKVVVGSIKIGFLNVIGFSGRRLTRCKDSLTWAKYRKGESEQMTAVPIHKEMGRKAISSIFKA